MRRLRYVVADVFTDTPLEGNQLAVFTDARDLDDATMQALAKEMAFSETVFVLPARAADADVRIRIFTPAAELPFAGHPTLGSAFVLGGPLQKIVLRLETGAGVVPVELEREGPEIRFGWMDQPIPTWKPFGETDALFAALGVTGSGLPVESYDLGPGFVYVELESADAVASLEPDLRELVRVVEVADVRPLGRRRRGSGHRVGCRAARRPPRPPRPDRVRRGDRDRAGRRARTAVAPLRARRGGAGPDRAGAGRRLRGDRRPRRVQASLSATAEISGSSTSSGIQKTPPSRET
jgi:predicted PhzF superfamily epimerase YddE/YHI9